MRGFSLVFLARIYLGVTGSSLRLRQLSLKLSSGVISSPSLSQQADKAGTEEAWQAWQACQVSVGPLTCNC